MRKLFILLTIGAFIFSGCGNSGTQEKGVNETENIEYNKQEESLNNVSEEKIRSKPEEFSYGVSEEDNDCYTIESYLGEAEIIDIPDEYEGKKVVEIEKNAFAYSNIKEVSMGQNIKVIKDFAFTNCKSLAKVQFNSSLERIEDMAFSETALIEIELPDSLKEIGVGVFCMSESIERVKFGIGKVSMEGQVFADDSSLKTVYINNDNVQFLENNIFENCKDVTIIAAKGSTSEQYAKKNNINFQER